MDSKPSSDDHTQLLQLKYKMYEIEQENKNLLKKLHIGDTEHQSARDSPKTVDKSFQEQIPVSDDHYKIPIAIRNKMVGVNGGDKENLSMAKFQMEDQNVLQQPIQGNGKSSTTTTTTPTSVVKKENLMSPAKLSSTVKTSARFKPLPKGLFKNSECFT